MRSKWKLVTFLGLVLLLVGSIVGCGESYTKEDLDVAYGTGHAEGYEAGSLEGYKVGYTEGKAAGLTELESAKKEADDTPAVKPDSTPRLTPVTFPDRNLEEGIRWALDWENIKEEGDEVIYAEELAKLERLWVTNNEGITDLTGLEYCTSLIELELNGNEITNISPLTALTRLTELSIYGNYITDLSPLSSLSRLTDLSLRDNLISDLSPLSSLTNLTSLSLEQNQIANISPLLANTGLSDGDVIYLRDNPLSDTSLNEHIPYLRERGVDVELSWR